MNERYDSKEIKARLPFLDLLAHEGIAMRRSGPHFVGLCPFHDERSGSFTVHGPAHDHGHCYGCGWNGDIFRLWQDRHGCGFVDALPALASLASLAPGVFESKRKQASQVTRMTMKEAAKKPTLPRMRHLRGDEVSALAKLRKLSVAGIEAAAAAGRLGACMWPQFLDRHGVWKESAEAAPSWVVTDETRNVAQFRRFDGVKYVIRRPDGEMNEIKAWTKGSPSWPLGCASMGGKWCVLLVEGGADMLACYHFLAGFRRLEAVAVCAILGGSARIGAEALPHFVGARMRIMMDEDEPKGPRKIIPGCESAARWTAQLIEAGAAVETFSLAGLVKKDGAKVKDVNDLAEVDEAAWLDPELRQAFFDFDF
jgi:hypothetical protein